MECNDSFVRSCKAAHLKDSHEMVQQRADLTVEVFEHGRILPAVPFRQNNTSFNRGGVVSKEGIYSELSFVPGWIVGGYECCEFVQDHRTAVYCGCLITQWGHFLLESITRLWYYLDHPQDDVVYIFIADGANDVRISRNYREFFELLGIFDKIEIIKAPTEYHKVIVPERSFQYKRFYTKQYKRILDAVAEQAFLKLDNRSDSYGQRVFLSRSQFPKAQRTEIGLDMLDDYFSKNGYQLIYPENLPLSELIVRLRQASECASESGTVAHNFLFCSDDQQITIIERQSMINDAQASIDQLRNFNVTYIDGHLTIYPVAFGNGPFFLYYTDTFEAYTKYRGYVPPSQKYRKELNQKRCLRQFMKAYQRSYYRQIIIDPIHVRCADSIFEAYTDTMRFLGPYLKGYKAYQMVQWLQPNFINHWLKGQRW